MNPQGMPFGAPMEASSTPNLAAINQRSNEFPRDAARPQRMANEGTAQGHGRGAPYGRGNARGGGPHRGRGGRVGAGITQKLHVSKPGGEDVPAGKPLGMQYVRLIAAIEHEPTINVSCHF